MPHGGRHAEAGPASRRPRHTKEQRDAALQKLARETASATPRTLGKHGRRKTARDRRIAAQRRVQAARRGVSRWAHARWPEARVRVRIAHEHVRPVFVGDTARGGVLPPR